MHTLVLLLKKEFILFRRNRFLPKIAFIFPCMVILIIPLVTTMDVKHVGVAVVNHGQDQISQEIITDLNASPYFSVVTPADFPAAMELVKTGTADIILEIPDNFQQNLDNGHPVLPHISANGVNGIKGNLGSRYVALSVVNTLGAAYGNKPEPENITINYFYNPTLEYRHYMIPALMIMLLIMLCGFLPALNLVGEKESGTIEQINVTPVKTPIFVLSKVIPFWIIGLVVITLAITIAAFIYGLRPAGSLSAIYIAAALFIFVMSGIGIIISNFSQTMSQSMFLMFFIVMVFVLMSGLMTPVSSMPRWARFLTYALPPRYFIEIMRSVYLKGTGMTGLCAGYIALALFAAGTNLLAVATYAKRR